MAAMLFIASLAAPSKANAQNSLNTSISLDSWKTIKFSYSSSTLEFDNIYNIDDMDFNVFSFEYLEGYNIIDNKPVFLEWGIGAEVMNMKDEESAIIEGTYIAAETSTTIVDFYIPVNIGYKLAINNNTTIMPYVGIKAQLNIFAEERMEVSAGTYSEKETINLFDRKDMGDNYVKHGWLGWHIGATVEINNWSIGVRYGKSITDEFINKIDDCKFTSTTVSVGYFF